MRCLLIAPIRTILLMIAALAPTLTAGCGGDEELSGVTVVQELRGDTVVMVSSGEPERVQIETVEVLWQSDEFRGGHMSRMARLDDHLVIGDSYRIHVVPLQYGGAHTFGREGDGPMEFQRTIHFVGEFGTDTIAAYDGSKVLLFSVDGEFLTSHSTTDRPPFSGVVMGFSGRDQPVYPLVRSGSGVLWEKTSQDGNRTERKALVWHDLEADTAAVLQIWDYRGENGPAFPELVEHAIASDGRVVTGYPADYCIRIFHASEEGDRMGCRERARIPVEAGFYDLSGVPSDWVPARREGLARQVEANPADVLPHFDRMLFSDSGDLWVNLYHEEFAHVHRFFYSFLEWQPTAYEWEVFDREAVLVRHVTLPGAFDLKVIGDGEAFGFFTLDTGEVVVGRVDLTESAVPPA